MIIKNLTLLLLFPALLFGQDHIFNGSATTVYADLNAAIAAAEADSSSVSVLNPILLTSRDTLQSYTPIIFGLNGSVKAGSARLVIAGPVSAGIYQQIFDEPDSVVFLAGSVPEVSTNWFGPYVSTAYDTVVENALIATGGLIGVRIPAGNYTFADVLDIEPDATNDDILLYGDTGYKTILTWPDSTNTPAITVNANANSVATRQTHRVSNVEIHDLKIIHNGEDQDLSNVGFVNWGYVPGALNVLSVDNARIHDLWFIDPQGSAVQIRDGSSVQISNILVDGFYFTPPNDWGSGGYGNVIDIHYSGPSTYFGKNALVNNIIINGNSSDGYANVTGNMDLGINFGGRFENIICTNNIVRHSNNYGINLEWGQAIESDSTFYPYTIFANNLVDSANICYTITNNSQTGKPASGRVIFANNIGRNSNYGMRLLDGPSNIIGNLFENVYSGLIIDASTNNGTQYNHKDININENTFILADSNTTAGYGIYIATSNVAAYADSGAFSNIKISNNTISKLDSTYNGNQSTKGILLGGAVENFTVDNNTISYMDDAGIYITGQASMEKAPRYGSITNNLIYNNNRSNGDLSQPTSGIQTAADSMNNITISKNRLYDNTGDDYMTGIVIGGAGVTNLTLTENNTKGVANTPFNVNDAPSGLVQRNNQWYSGEIEGTATAQGTTAVTVTTNAARTGMTVEFTLNTSGGSGPAGQPYVSALTSGTSFQFKAAALDSSVYKWRIIN